jgi:hypothetical protein
MNVLNEVHKSGVSYIKNFLSKEKCNQLQKEIDENISKYSEKLNTCEIDVNSADKRLYGYENLSEITKELFHENNFVTTTLKQLYKSKNIVGTIMAQRTDPEIGNVGSAGYWHRDSLKSQYKAFLYLSDVFENSGPFQYLKNSHSFLNKSLTTLRVGIGKRNNQNYDTHSKFNKIIGSKEIKSLTCKQGTLAFVNTSLVHRGKPKIESKRYALSYYVYQGELPKGVKKAIISKTG